MALCWFGVRRGDWRARLAAMVSPVVGLIAALPMHYLGLFDHNWVTHIGPINLGTAIFVGGGLLALSALVKSDATADVRSGRQTTPVTRQAQTAAGTLFDANGRPHFRAYNGTPSPCRRSRPALVSGPSA